MKANRFSAMATVLASLFSRQFASSFRTRAMISHRSRRRAIPRQLGFVPAASVSNPFHAKCLLYQQQFTTSLQTYRDDNIIEDDGVIVEEVLDVNDVKHYSSSMQIEEENADQTKSPNSDSSGDKIKRKQLKKELTQYRIDQSESISKPAWNIFTNAALDGICASLPATKEELLQVKGIGPKKLEMYGDDILDIVGKYTADGTLTPEQVAAGTTSTTSNKSKLLKRPEPIQFESLTQEQRQAALMALEGKSIFISGAAGTGKSHVSKYIIQSLQRQTKKVTPTAPTGVAAINVGGSTLHSFFGIGLGLGSVPSLVRKIRKKQAVVQRINETDVLLIDEVSMLSCDLLETLDGVARLVREREDEPMGGLQIVAVGDFYQLPPIVKQPHQKEPTIFQDETQDSRLFCFDSPIWTELGLHTNTIQLSKVQRQEHGSKFEMFLGMVRNGNVPSNILRDFNRKCLISNDNPLPEDGIIPTRIYTHNADVDSMNESRLAQLEGKEVICTAIDEWRERMPVGTSPTVKKNMKASIAGELANEVRLKVGAQVMLTRNKDLENGYQSLVNGSRGVVESFKDDLPIVRFDNGRVEKVAKVEATRYNPDGGVGALVRKQLPLKLAWATTVHKSQGSTLTRAILDISKAFEAGMAYVSLSRVKDIEGLYLERPGETTCEFVALHLTRAFENTLMAISVYTRNLTPVSLSHV